MISDAYFTRESTCIAGLHKLLKHFIWKLCSILIRFAANNVLSTLKLCSNRRTVYSGIHLILNWEVMKQSSGWCMSVWRTFSSFRQRACFQKWPNVFTGRANSGWNYISPTRNKERTVFIHTINRKMSNSNPWYMAPASDTHGSVLIFHKSYGLVLFATWMFIDLFVAENYRFMTRN